MSDTKKPSEYLAETINTYVGNAEQAAYERGKRDGAGASFWYFVGGKIIRCGTASDVETANEHLSEENEIIRGEIKRLQEELAISERKLRDEIMQKCELGRKLFDADATVAPKIQDAYDKGRASGIKVGRLTAFGESFRIVAFRSRWLRTAHRKIEQLYNEAMSL